MPDGAVSLASTSASSLIRGDYSLDVGHLEHKLLAVPLDEQGDRAGPLAQACGRREAAGQEIPLLRLGRVGHVVVFGRGQLLLDLVEVAEEVGRRVGAAGHVGVGAELDQVLQGLAGPVEHVADLQAPGLPQLVAQLQAVRPPAARPRRRGRRWPPARRRPDARPGCHPETASGAM